MSISEYIVKIQYIPMTPRAVLRTLVRPVEGNLPKISGLKSRER